MSLLAHISAPTDTAVTVLFVIAFILFAVGLVLSWAQKAVTQALLFGGLAAWVLVLAWQALAR